MLLPNCIYILIINNQPTSFLRNRLTAVPLGRFIRAMAKGLIWTTAKDSGRSRGRVLSLYRQILRSLNSPALPLNLAARLSKKAEVRVMFLLGSEDRSLHNIEDLINAAEHSLSLLRKGQIPKLTE